MDGALTLRLVVLAVACPLLVTDAGAVPITYTATTIASGSWGASAFTDRQVTVSFVGHTAEITHPVPDVYTNELGTAAVAVAGVGTGTLTGGRQIAIVNRLVPGVAIGANSLDPTVDHSGQTFVLGASAPVFAAYDLNGAIGPQVGSALFVPGLGFATDAGVFTLISVGDVTLTALTGATTMSWRAVGRSRPRRPSARHSRTG